jgi:hypothetical protein
MEYGIYCVLWQYLPNNGNIKIQVPGFLNLQGLGNLGL